VTGCAFGDEPAELRHHPTGRDEHGRYLDPDLTLPACHDDHTFVHDDWRDLGIEAVERPLTFFDRVETRLRRLATNCRRMDPAGVNPFWTKLAAALVRWADEIARGTRRLDERDPGWRDDPGFYPDGPAR